MLKLMHKFVEELSLKMKREQGRVNHLTPKSYLELLNLYKTILEEKNSELLGQLERLEEGMSKLINANNQVDSLKETLKKQEP